jgi:quinol monooxygenase YgiN
MAVLVNTNLGLDISVYDQLAAGLTETLKAAPGFRTHAAYPVEGGFIVTEIWDDAEAHRAFFDSAVKPNIPDGVPLSLQVIELRNTVGL